jgi:hypothetical protein
MAKRKYRGYDSPLECFIDKYGDEKIKRRQLAKEDGGLYFSLRRNDQLDEAIPKTYRGYDSPLHYFNDKFKDRDITRKQLAKEDSGLYSSLRRRDLLDYAIPEKMRRKYWR